MNTLHASHRPTLQRTNRVKRLGKLIVMTLLFGVFQFGVAPYLKAQCPPGYASATTTTTVTINCGGVRVNYTFNVVYCTPIAPVSPPHVVIASISPQPGPIPPGCNVDGITMREIGRKLIQTINPCSGSGCPSIIPRYEVRWAPCVMYDAGNNEYIPCGAPQGNCLDWYYICCPCQGPPTILYRGTSQTDACEWQLGCITVCAPGGAPDPGICP